MKTLPPERKAVSVCESPKSPNTMLLAAAAKGKTAGGDRPLSVPENTNKEDVCGEAMPTTRFEYGKLLNKFSEAMAVMPPETATVCGAPKPPLPSPEKTKRLLPPSAATTMS